MADLVDYLRDKLAAMEQMRCMRPRIPEYERTLTPGTRLINNCAEHGFEQWYVTGMDLNENGFGSTTVPGRQRRWWRR